MKNRLLARTSRSCLNVRRVSAVLVVAALALGAAVVSAASGAADAALTINPVLVTSGLSFPVDIANAGDSRLFVVEKVGRIRIISGGLLLPTPFLDINERVNAGGSEQGLLGLAFHPEYASTGYFYVNYTNLQGDTHISRFTVNSGNPNLADAGSEQILLFQDQPFSNHNGGGLKFGPDGYLYIGLGDGGSGGDPQNHAQNPESLLGKMLRLDVDGGFPYAIPADNPFVGDPTTADEIWALGLRNPWRYSFDRVTGDLYIADVGQGAWEEVNLQSAPSPGGENYGWRCYEGNHDYNLTGCDTPSAYAFPIHEYSHADGCSITGGVVYRGSLFPGMTGRYFFSDFCNPTLWSLHADGIGGWLLDDHGLILNSVTTFGEDSAGEIYYADYTGGRIYRLAQTVPSTPTLSTAGAAALLALLSTLLFLARRKKHLPAANAGA